MKKIFLYAFSYFGFFGWLLMVGLYASCQVDPIKLGDDPPDVNNNETSCATDLACPDDATGIYVYAPGCEAESTSPSRWQAPFTTLEDAIIEDDGDSTADQIIYIAGQYGDVTLENTYHKHIVACEGASISHLVISGGSYDITVEDFDITSTVTGSNGAIEVLSSGSSSGVIQLNNLSLNANAASYGAYISNSENVAINTLDTLDETPPSDGNLHSFIEVESSGNVELGNINYAAFTYDFGIWVEDGSNIKIGYVDGARISGGCQISYAGIAQIGFADTQSSYVNECTLEGDGSGANLFAIDSEVVIETLDSSYNKAGVVTCADTGLPANNYTLDMSASTMDHNTGYDLVVGSIELIGSSDIGTLWVPSDQGGDVSGFTNTNSAPTTSTTANTRTTFCDLTDILSEI